MNSEKTHVVLIDTSAGSRAKHIEGPKEMEKHSVGLGAQALTLATPGFTSQLSQLGSG